MARRRFVRGRRRSSPNVFWEQNTLAQNLMPAANLDSANAVDGTFSAFRRFTESSDKTILRSIGGVIGSIVTLGNQVSDDAVLSLCIALHVGDDLQSLNGQAQVSDYGAAGAGLLSDADSNQWYVRCCIFIPIGEMSFYLANQENLVYPLGPNASWWHFGGAEGAAQRIGFRCNWDTKTRRRLQGSDTPWLNLGMECAVAPTPAVGDDISVLITGFENRMVMRDSA